MGVLAQAKNGDEQFWKWKFNAVNGNAQHASKCLDFFSFKFWVGVVGGWGKDFFFFPLFPTCSI
jgi:hypothetical protein